jgi:hypothetical protein
MNPPAAVRTGHWRSARVLLLAALLAPGACDDGDPPPPDAALDAVIAGPTVVDGG